MFDNKLAEQLTKKLVNNELTLEDILILFKENFITLEVTIQVLKFYIGDKKDVSTNL